MESLESCVERLDLRSMPQFLDQISDARENEVSRHFAISLYAELARVHKRAVIPFIPRMMASIVRSLPFSADSQQLHEACAKVVTSVARYTIDPTRPYDSNKQILCSLCSPLLPVLSSKLESSAAGAAICLQALVESEKWKFADSDLQDLICMKATSSLVEQGTHAVTFLHLVKSLAKFCLDASKKHIAEWLRVGLQILQADSVLWQRRLAAAQLITIIVKTADADILGLDLPSIIKILETCLLDKVIVVQTAVAEAFETAKCASLDKHFLCGGKHEYSTPSKTDLNYDRRRRFSDTEESGMQDPFSSVSPRSGASSHEAVPSMASSTVKFGTETKRPKHRAKNASCLYNLSGSPSRTSMLKENTPATIPRRVLSEIPASGKRLSNADSLPSSWGAKSLRRSSMDLRSKAASYSMQNQSSLGSRKYVQLVNGPILDGVTRTASLVKKHADGCQNNNNTECMCIADLEKQESISLESVAVHQSDINCKEDAKTKTLEELDEKAKESEQNLLGGSLNERRYFHADCITSESDRDVGCADGGPLLKDTSMEARSKDLSLPEKESRLKVSNSQDFAFRAPGSLLHSIQGKGSAKDTRQSCKDCSDCENRSPRGACWTTSDSFASGDCEEDQLISDHFQSRNATTVASCCRSEESDTNLNKKYKSSSRSNRDSFQSTSESDCRLSSVLPNDSEISASGQDWPSSRDSSDQEAAHNAKVGHRHADSNLHQSNKESGSQRHCFAQAEGRPELPAELDIKLKALLHSGKGSAVSGNFKEQMCVGAALGLFCAVGVLILAVMVIQHANQSFGLHALVPT